VANVGVADTSQGPPVQQEVGNRGVFLAAAVRQEQSDMARGFHVFSRHEKDADDNHGDKARDTRAVPVSRPG
jgi:hypothetical protein